MKRRNQTSEEGSSPASVLILLVLVLLMAELIVMGGRIAAAKADVANAAREGARQGSLAAGPGTYQQIVRTTVTENLKDRGNTCAPQQPSFVGSDFSTNGQVKIAVTCRVDLSDLSLLNLSVWPNVDMVAQHTEVIEQYRVIAP